MLGNELASKLTHFPQRETCRRPQAMKKMYFGPSFFLLTYLLLSSVVSPQTDDFKWSRGPDRLYQVSKWDAKSRGKRIGFIDHTGKLIIDYDRLPSATAMVGEFHEGRAAIYLNKVSPPGSTAYDVGFIDETGKMVVPPRFRSARSFSEGLAFVDGREFRGFIDLQGKPVIKTDDYTRDFHEGLAAVSSSEGFSPWGYIDRSGKMVVEKQYSFADDFSEGLAGVVVNRKFGFINQNGEMVIPPRFIPRRGPYSYSGVVATSRFSEGLAPVATELKYGLDGVYGYIDRKGDFVIPPQFHAAQIFSEGLALVVKMERVTNVVTSAGWIDKSGHRIVTEVQGRISESLFPKTFMDPHGYSDWRYSEGLVPFLIPQNKGKPLRGYMDRRGKIVIEPRAFNKVGPFVGGLARVYVDGDERQSNDYGYINKTGQFIWRSK
jgi:hypothetical protein